jgi:hypothetical protein
MGTTYDPLPRRCDDSGGGFGWGFGWGLGVGFQGWDSWVVGF